MIASDYRAGALLLCVALAGCETAQASLSAELRVQRDRSPRQSRAARRCPDEMVDVAGRFCIDRFEVTLYERGTGRRVSPHYHPSRELALRDEKDWRERAPRIGPVSARKKPLPELPAWERERDFEIMARSERGQIPNAYLDLNSARSACVGAGKRLCTRDEWLTACRSDRATRHPYGEKFEPGRCNIERVHPASTLHGRDLLGELDPRMNLVEHGGSRLLFPTGNMPDCASRWESDRIYDMVGNLDEWIEDPGGVFVGGFYARETRHGCDARIDLHSPEYYDYSLGTRCCR